MIASSGARSGGKPDGNRRRVDPRQVPDMRYMDPGACKSMINQAAAGFKQDQSSSPGANRFQSGLSTDFVDKFVQFSA